MQDKIYWISNLLKDFWFRPKRNCRSQEGKFQYQRRNLWKAPFPSTYWNARLTNDCTHGFGSLDGPRTIIYAAWDDERSSLRFKLIYSSAREINLHDEWIFFVFALVTLTLNYRVCLTQWIKGQWDKISHPMKNLVRLKYKETKSSEYTGCSVKKTSGFLT